ncbi:Uncharacterized protein conserved in bacteria [Delftia tsuruhatensis]|uniref:type VI secretion system baseplate subunit TssG n=1 Tax=Delftia tsuruhatensis TaxID=180282 RepID=UPI001E7C2414|nr:type VI secretion system baseplate subunit TssG [Delftia tsuruhatensis]CAB5723849.1 Uncharacterized protein conserved in bacteria [Delftia tsuruhatensis]CAC9685064.1 Uncharacterized protein conserved in bacteria [Delftia tsuruhatensis]
MEPSVSSTGHDRPDGTPAARYAWLEQAEAAPEKLDLFALLRHVDASRPASARLGYSQTPREDAVRLGQHPSTIFAPSTIYSVDPAGKVPRIKILSLGVFGPNGALPIHLTEYVRERLHNHGDSAPADFVDMFHHRLISLFYRAWADAQATVQLDRPGLDKFSFYAGALVGMGFEGSWERDTVPDSARLYAAGHLVRLTRNPEGLEQILGHFFRTTARITEFVPTWVPIAPGEQTTLSGMHVKNQLGGGAIAGSRVQDVQSKFRLTLGPMRLRQFESFLPPNGSNRQLRDWVRSYIGLERDWDVDLLLHADEVPQARLGASQQLGWTSWLGRRPSRTPANELRLNPEKDARRFPLPHPSTSGPSTMADGRPAP